MGLTTETIAQINQRAERIQKERDKRAARDERAKTRHEARKATIRQELSDLNVQLTQSPQLQKSLSEMLRAKNGYQTFKEVDQIGLCIGLPISQTSDQTAVMTEEGIQVLESNWRSGYIASFGHYTTECFTLLPLDRADIEELFPKSKFKVGQLADDIAKIILQSPNKK
ncbi:hypothetical protein HZB78_03795 [Candidatus Collierbacteria bacterium]|nr:hypothetical protein [Candidatus Collierbacteria bacterium]